MSIWTVRPPEIWSISRGVLTAKPRPTTGCCVAGKSPSWRTRTGSSWLGGGAEIACDGSLVAIPSPQGVHESVDAAVVEVTRDGAARQFYAALVGADRS